MAKKKKTTGQEAKQAHQSVFEPTGPYSGGATRARPINLFEQSDSGDPIETGRLMVTTLDEQDDSADLVFKSLKDKLGVKRVVRSHERSPPEVGTDAEALLLESLGIFVLELDPEQTERARELADTERDRAVKKDGFVIESEYFCQHAGREHSDLPITESGKRSLEYLKGYRDALDQFLDEPMIDEPEADTRAFERHDLEQIPRRIAEASRQSRSLGSSVTWGLDETDVPDSRFSGNGVRVGVVDTGIDLSHPDFRGRIVDSVSYVGRTAQDDNGHGTHCAGTLCGQENSTKRYGVARKAEVCVAKVLGRDGRGREANVIAGIDWALQRGCRVISVSIERGVNSCRLGYPVAYEAAGLRAIQRNSLVIAAAGNRSDRRVNFFRPVSAPANTPSIIGVGAVRENRGMAYFSNRATCKHGEVNFVAPGNNVFSADLGPSRFRARSGTSMAVPHVSGIAALLLERDAGLTTRELYSQLRMLCRTAPNLNKKDFGHGLVQAPT